MTRSCWIVDIFLYNINTKNVIIRWNRDFHCACGVWSGTNFLEIGIQFNIMFFADNSHLRRYMNTTRNLVSGYPGIISPSVGMTMGTNTAPSFDPLMCTVYQPSHPGLRQPPYVQPRPCLCEPTYTTLKPVSHVGLHPSGSAPSFNHILSMPSWIENPLWYGQEQVPYRPWMSSQYIAPPANESQNRRM